MEKLPTGTFNTNEEEIAFLRGELERVKNESEQVGVEHQTEAVIKNYSTVGPEQVLSPERAMPERQANMIAMNLAPEEHDAKISELLNLVVEKGVKNTLTIAEKLENPHLLDDFHRALVAYIEATLQLDNFTEKDPLWKPLHMKLYEVILPGAKDDQGEKKLDELISGMEQFYSGMLSVAEEGKSGSWFTLEIAKETESDNFAFYVSVPRESAHLLEKQVLSIFPDANVVESQNDYNIFNDSGSAVASYAKFEKSSLYPLSPYDEFDTDPLSVILNSFSKIDRDGEGAAIQLVVGPRQDHYAEKGFKAIEAIRSGERVEDALAEINSGFATRAAQSLFSVFKNAEQEAKEKEKKQERASRVDSELLEQFTRKVKSQLAAVSVRVVASAASEPEAKAILSDIQASFGQFQNARGNRLVWQSATGNKLDSLLKDFTFRTWNDQQKMIWNLEEMTTVVHFPVATLAKMAPQLRQNQSATAPAPLDLPSEGTLLGINKFRGQETQVRITLEDRMRHFYIIGQTGTGKTTLMKNMITQDIEAGHGVCMIDPHGTDISDILGSIPAERQDDVIYFDPARTDMVLGLNMLEFDPAHPEQKTFVVNELFSIFQKLYGAVPESMGPMFEQYFRNATLLVLEDVESGSTLLDIARIFADADYRKLKLSKARNPVVVQFWNDIATQAGGEASLENIVPYITSKFDVFTANDFMRPIIGQQTSSFNFRQIMDERKILLVNLSKGRLGEINANLIGMIIVGKILMAALSRVDDISKGYAPFLLHMDEFQNITTDSISAILSEARKYKLGLTVAHQFIAQLDEKIRDAIFGNVGSLAAFRVGPEDAEFLEKQFTPVFTAGDLMNIENRQAYVRILSDGTPQKPFNIHTLPPKEIDPAQVQALIEHSYQRYARPRRQVEMEISSRYV